MPDKQQRENGADRSQAVAPESRRSAVGEDVSPASVRTQDCSQPNASWSGESAFKLNRCEQLIAVDAAATEPARDERVGEGQSSKTRGGRRVTAEYKAWAKDNRTHALGPGEDIRLGVRRPVVAEMDPVRADDTNKSRLPLAG